ncbi:hypothetical protein [Anoxybacillus sp. ST4]|uniref:hypothetical protein n=1 Tax=Anoxybacillus sp. ST4 TaxID=2864181 RepID=UPI001C644C48|nr:hypothetical protein [Anoxybacillus sp. ST4]MBW7652036.1 hypothetical protein [Anoxybacillus sp. ST4]
MDLIKGVKTKENFLTGERIELPYTKKAAPVRGFVKLELFDDLTGKKIEEITSENFISKYVYQYWDQLMRKSFIYHEGYLQGALAGFSTLLPFPFQTFVLLDYNKPEDPQNERVALGKLIGYATRSTYSGSDTKRGTINLAESFANAEQLHYVFDFPTHAASGTFQSLAWVAASVGNFVTWPHFNVKSFSGGTELKARALAVTDTEIYIKESFAPTVRVYDKATFQGGSTQPKRQFNLAYDQIFGFVYAMGFLWSVSYNDGKIRKVDPQNGATLATITPNSGTPSRLTGITFDGVDFWVTGDTSVYRVGQDGTVKQGFQQTGTEIMDIAYMPEFDAFIVADGYDSALQVRNRNMELLCYFGSYNSPDDDHCISYNNGEIWQSNYNDLLWKQTNAGLAARTLLPSAVTKTSMNTMKVTYDFILPSYNPIYL